MYECVYDCMPFTSLLHIDDGPSVVSFGALILQQKQEFKQYTFPGHTNIIQIHSCNQM